MKRVLPKLRELAQRLMACETPRGPSDDAKAHAAIRVCEKLRPHLATLMGNAGFRALLSRALALAVAEVPSLRALNVNAEGVLENSNHLHAKANADEILDGRIVLLAQLLGLLAVFIGEGMTLQLVREVWPQLSLTDLEFGNGVNE